MLLQFCAWETAQRSALPSMEPLRKESTGICSPHRAGTNPGFRHNFLVRSQRRRYKMRRCSDIYGLFREWTVRNYKSVKRGLHFYAKSGMISQARKSTTHCEDQPVAVWDFAPRSDCCEAIAGRRLRLFLPSVSKEREYTYESFRANSKCTELGNSQNADFGSPAHVCHVWRNGAGAQFWSKATVCPCPFKRPCCLPALELCFFTSAPS